MRTARRTSRFWLVGGGLCIAVGAVLIAVILVATASRGPVVVTGSVSYDIGAKHSFRIRSIRGNRNRFSAMQRAVFHVAGMFACDGGSGFGVSRPSFDIFGRYDETEQQITITFRSRSYVAKLRMTYDAEEMTLKYGNDVFHLDHGRYFAVYKGVHGAPILEQLSEVPDNFTESESSLLSVYCGRLRRLLLSDDSTAVSMAEEALKSCKDRARP